ncbi:MAG: hypothetical protein PHO26_02015 [Dehalococcoidia bacterium]|nr:hypothetical protein [Dehalococcoidia bacterium]
MQKRNLALIVLSAALIFTAACCANPANPLQGGIKTYPPASPDDQEITAPPAPPASPAIQPAQTTERQVTVTAGNSVFSIGLPPGYKEERQVTAQKPIDFLFEYVTSDMSLEVNGVPVETPLRWADKIGYTTNVTGFKYVMKNNSSQAVAYNLHMVPSKQGDSVPVVTKEKWTAP